MAIHFDIKASKNLISFATDEDGDCKVKGSEAALRELREMFSEEVAEIRFEGDPDFDDVRGDAEEGP